uniref:Uncharacterized protein n=1 Tax=Syphacia muris TaxID=451379 RepID=A0A0N5AUN3_9BILA
MSSLNLHATATAAAAAAELWTVRLWAINFVDATKHGFRIILVDSFVERYLSPTQIPTLFITAIPLKIGEKTLTKIIYPDNVREDKQVTISDLNQQSWYYVCVEWENFNRHNESTGTDCRMIRTLDRSGRSADSVVDDAQIVDITSTTMQFKILTSADFLIRLTASLEGGSGPVPPAKTFLLKRPADIQLSFQSLAQDHDYGKLCIVEEPLLTGYTTMGRLASQIYIRKCYFTEGLRTKDYELSTMDIEPSAFKHELSLAPTTTHSLILLKLLTILLVIYQNR